MKTQELKRGLLPGFRNWIDEFLVDEEPFFDRWHTALTTPMVNVAEREDRVEVEVAAPGMKREDFEITVENEVLAVKAEHREEVEEKEDNFWRQEFNFSSFRRAFRLPEIVDESAIRAEYTNGLLKITLPKKRSEEKGADKFTISVN